MKKYFPSEIEPKLQKKWEKDGLYRFGKLTTGKVNNKGNPTSLKLRGARKFYNLVELPYPSGDLHLGHWFAFVPPDAYARFKRMNGFNVFFPMGFDAFGLPAENAAIKRKIHPKDWTMKNIKTMTKQFATMGTMIDWDHVTVTCLPEYYRWNQWIFLKMFKKGIAYRGKALSNWCPTDQTVLANEHIEAGKCWRCGSEVVQKEVEQWFLRITKYADELIWKNDPSASLRVNWPKMVREGQNNWIGKKEGINITYKIKDSIQTITVFTTRPDTNFGATFIALAPENPLVEKLTKPENKKEVEKYLEKAKKKTEIERMAEAREKTGVFTGSYAINDLTGYKMPIWVSDFVLIGFGTGALVGVPGHDKRDFEFAKKFKFEIKRVVVGKDGDQSPITKIEQVQEDEGNIINSKFLDGLDIHKATEKIMNYLEEKGWGKRVTTYHLRDWSVSRQRYWGTPVPIIHCKKCGLVPVPQKDLPVELPYNVDYTPKGKPPLATAADWLKVKCPKCDGNAERDTETLDTFFDSAWYYYRYVSPKFKEGPFDEEEVKKIMPVDVYFGGAEHTLGHTLYARFFTKFFKDLGLVDFDEFSLKRVQHGVILGPDGNRMSKSKGNVVNPDDVVKEYGADTVRIYLCFIMPYEATGPWSPGAISGIFRFLRRIWDLSDKVSDVKLTKEDLANMHFAIKNVTEDLENLHFNTAVSGLMTWINYLSKKKAVSKEEYETFLKLLSPFAPHITEELYQNLKFKVKSSKFESIHIQSWPKFDPKQIAQSQTTIIVQVNGKLRDSILVESSKVNDQKFVEELAKEGRAKNYIKVVRKIIYVSGKILNFVV